MAEVSDLLVKIGTEFDENGVKKAEGAFKGFVVTLGDVINIAQKVIAFGKQFVTSAAEQEKAQKLLANAIDITGNSSKTTIDKLTLFATNLQKITTVSDESSMNLMQFGLSMGISGEKIEQATMQAIGLSKAFGVDLHTSMKLVSLAGEGNYDMLGRYIPQIRKTKDIVEKAMIANDAMAKGFELAKKEGETFTGKAEILNNRIDELYESIGMSLLPVLIDLINFINGNVLPAFESFFDKETNVNTITETLGNSFKWVLKIALGVVSAVDLITDGIVNLTGAITGLAAGNIHMFKAAVDGFKRMSDKTVQYGKKFEDIENMKVQTTAAAQTAITNTMAVQTAAREAIAITEAEAIAGRKLNEEIMGKGVLERSAEREQLAYEQRTMWLNAYSGAVGDALGFIYNAETITWSTIAEGYRQSIKKMIGYIVQQLAAEKIKALAIAAMNTTITWGAAAYQMGAVIAAFTAAAAGLAALKFDKGGIVPGRIGAPQLAIVHGGETILPTHRNAFAGSMSINVTVPPIATRQEARRMGEIVGNEIMNRIKRNRKV